MEMPVKKPEKKTAKKRRPKTAPRKHPKKAAPRKAAKKTKAKRPARKLGDRTLPRVTGVQFQISGKKKATDMKFVSSPRHGTGYQPILNEIKEKLRKEGDGFEVTIPAGLTPRVFHNRLNAMLRRVKPKIPPGLRIDKRTVAGGKVGFIAVAGK